MAAPQPTSSRRRAAGAANDAHSDPALDAKLMERALRLARRGEGRVEPNPMVGCVIARGQRVLGEGYHRRFGGPHAEIEALRSAGDARAVRGATVYVTLEPCCHFGKTPPCTDALIAAGVGRVVAGYLDANPAVAGQGVQQLRRAGINTEVGLLAGPARQLLAPYLTQLHLHRPYVIAKWAQSLDGKLATRTGDSQWISSPESRRQVHRLRSRVDAVLVGLQTVLADDPLLTARDVPLRRVAARVVVDAALHLPRRCQLVRTARDVPVWVLTTAQAARGPKAGYLEQAGVQLLTVPKRGNTFRWPDLLRTLAKQGVTNLLVEGGSTVLSGLLDAELVDEALVYVAPLLLGGAAAPTAWAGRGRPRVSKALSPTAHRVRPSGRDMLWHLHWDHLPR